VDSLLKVSRRMVDAFMRRMLAVGDMVSSKLSEESSLMTVPRIYEDFLASVGLALWRAQSRCCF